MKDEINPNYEKLTLNEKKIVDLVTTFCQEKLDEEYLDLCSDLMEEYNDVVENVFHKGKPEIWASAIIYAIGSINFLFDKNTEPYVSISEITEYFGTKKTTITNKGREIKQLLNINMYDYDFSRLDILEHNPFDNLSIVDGFIIINDDLKEIPKSKSENKTTEKKTDAEIEKENEELKEKKKLNFGLFEGMDF